MNTFGFILMGEPVPKARPRITKFGAYTPKETVEAERYLMHTALMASGLSIGETVFEKGSALEMVVDFTVAIPQSWSKKKQLNAVNQVLFPTFRPDLDNYIKLVKDALNGVVYEDDSCIVAIKARKRYGVEPMTMVTFLRVSPSE